MNLPEPKFQVEGLIPEKGITILGGYQSTFKSHLASHIALCLIHGQPAFGKFECKRGNVWYVNEEMHTGGFQKLLKRIARGLGVDVTKDLLVTNFQNKKIDKDKDNKAYSDLIKKHNIKFVIFDAFRECFVAPENSADEITNVLSDYVRPIIEETGCSFLIIMHKGKAGAGTDMRQRVDLIRGSSVFRNYVDSIILIERVRKTGRVEVTHEKVRSAKEQEKFNVNWQFEDDKIIAKCLTEEETEKLLVDDCKLEMMAYLKKGDLEKFESVPLFDKKLKKSYSRGTFYTALNELKNEGKVRKIKRGFYEVVGRGLGEF